MKKQSGFTLIELAIVLVIIGLLLGGVLKGQELINSAKVKNLAADFKNTQVFVYGYQDKYKAIPGDDPGADTRFGTDGKKASGGSKSGVIEGAWDTPADDAESCVFWQHVRLANLATGLSAKTDIDCSGANDYMPKNAEGGVTGIEGVSDFNTVKGFTADPLRGAFVVCSSQVRGSFVKQLDTLLDDGETSKGNVRAYKTAGAWATTASIDSTEESVQYNICMAF